VEASVNAFVTRDRILTIVVIAPPLTTEEEEGEGLHLEDSDRRRKILLIFQN